MEGKNEEVRRKKSGDGRKVKGRESKAEGRGKKEEWRWKERKKKGEKGKDIGGEGKRKGTGFLINYLAQHTYLNKHFFIITVKNLILNINNTVKKTLDMTLINKINDFIYD